MKLKFKLQTFLAKTTPNRTEPNPTEPNRTQPNRFTPSTSDMPQQKYHTRYYHPIGKSQGSRLK